MTALAASRGHPQQDACARRCRRGAERQCEREYGAGDYRCSRELANQLQLRDTSFSVRLWGASCDRVVATQGTGAVPGAIEKFTIGDRPPPIS